MNIIDEGYVKYQCHWTKTPPIEKDVVTRLNQARSIMYNLGVIGVYDNGIGFGNISQRISGNKFCISGTSTGHLANLDARHYSIVDKVEVHSNQVWCSGAISASSETMSHAVIYDTCPEVNMVIHIHDLAIWKTILYQVPTTRKDAAYGTPEMAEEIIHLLNTSEVRQRPKYFAMAGHREGIMIFGDTVEEAIEIARCLVECDI